MSHLYSLRFPAMLLLGISMSFSLSCSKQKSGSEKGAILDDSSRPPTDSDSTPQASTYPRSTSLTKELLAFPSAEGFGAYATGGRGGRVVAVSTLSPKGPGSLHAALNTPGPRIIIFQVSGIIDLPLVEIPHGDLTIAGESAPGAGITLRGRLYAKYEHGVDNIIVRHLRIRPPAPKGIKGEQFDAMQFSRSKQVIFDHISVAFGVDETIDLYESEGVTLQWSTIEGSATKGHPEGPHNFGAIQGPDGFEISIHHNLFAHHKSRTPAIANGPAEVINNISYNVRQGFVHHNDASGHFSIVGNTYKRGPSSELFPFYFDYDSPGRNLGYYLHDNRIDDPEHFVGVINNPWAQKKSHPAFAYLEQEANGSSQRFRSDIAFDQGAEAEGKHQKVTVSEAQVGYDAVLQRAGAFPRDLITKRELRDVIERTGSWGARRPSDLMQGLHPSQAPRDSDGDFLPDAWEAQHGLNPNSAKDQQLKMPSGYPAIEEWLHQKADALLAN